MIDRMDRLRELRSLRRSIAEKDAERAKLARSEFERKVASAEDAHSRAVNDSTTRRRAALDALSSMPATPLSLARMANVNAVVDQEIADAASEVSSAQQELEQANEELTEKRDVLANFLKREAAMDHAIERRDAERERADDGMEEDGEA